MNQGPSPAAPRVELFGAPRIRLGVDDAPLRPGKKPLALLAWLAAHPGREQSRETLAALLWPDRMEEQARQSLRQALAALRKALGAHEGALVGSSDGLLRYDPAALGSDVATFERLASSAVVEDLTAAAALYQGHFLAELGSVSDAFDAWAAQERDRLRALGVRTLERLATLHQTAGRIPEALAQAQRLVAVDPAHEAGHRLLMSLYAASGQRAAALRQFEECRRALAEHLDAEPDAQTAELHRTIRDAEPSLASIPAPTHPDAPARSSSPPSPRKIRPQTVVRLALRHRMLLGATAAAAAVLVLIPRITPGAPAPASASATVDACLGEASAEPTLVVLPLRTFGEDPELGRFAAAATDGIQAASSLVSGVDIVVGPPPGHPDLGLSPTEIATRTGASHLLEGSVRRRGDELQASLRLVDGRSGRQLWRSSTRHEHAADSLAAQDEIALTAALGIQETLTEGRQTISYRRFGSGSLAVWEHNTQGYGLISQADRVSNEQARAEFEASLAIDPNDPGALTGVAFTHLSAVLFGWSGDPAVDIAAARTRIEAALARLPEHPPALSGQAILALLDGDHAAAVGHGEDALRLSGGGGDAAAFLAYVLSYTDAVERSAELARRAVRSRPYAHPPWYDWTLARALRLSGDPETAVACLGGGAVEGATPTVELALAQAAAGDLAAARQAAASIREQAGDAFSATLYCSLPPPSDARVADACVEALAALGLPH